jgi:polysaccharide deacetylase family protein (PEP-CTERM system associated)
MKLIYSIDWEDFGQLSHKNRHNIILPPKEHIDRQTKIILDQLDAHNVKATFFILGICAKFRKDLVKLIDQRGHEIAIHGTRHDSLTSLTKKEIKEDILDSYNLVNDIIGRKVKGYRAPYYSMVESRLGTLEILSEIGIKYDSSIYPASFARYSIPDVDSKYVNLQLTNKSNIVELPVSVLRFNKYKIPLSGGGYFRLANKHLLKKLFKNMASSNDYAILYMHPYEFDSCNINVEQYADEGFKIHNKRKINFRWNLFRSSIFDKMEYFLSNYSFRTCEEVYNEVIQHKPQPIEAWIKRDHLE